MFSVVSERSDPYGGLDGYIYVDGAPPKRKYDWVNPSKRETAPFESVPAPTITASAAHPGRKSNACIPYTRVCSLSACRVFGAEGELTFVSGEDRALIGAGQERLSVSLGWQELNSKLQTHKAGATTLAANRDPFSEWRTVSELARWRLDGVVLSNPDGTESSHPTYDSIDGEQTETTAINVCVAGVCSIVNVFGTHCGDYLFIGLVATRAQSGYWQFEYVPFTHDALNGGSKALSKADLDGLVGAWRVGRVMDSAAAVDKWPRANEKEHLLTINVSIEWVPTKPGAIVSPTVDEDGKTPAGLFERYARASPVSLSPEELEKRAAEEAARKKAAEEAAAKRAAEEELAREAAEKAARLAAEAKKAKDAADALARTAAADAKKKAEKEAAAKRAAKEAEEQAVKEANAKKAAEAALARKEAEEAAKQAAEAAAAKKAAEDAAARQAIEAAEKEAARKKLELAAQALAEAKAAEKAAEEAEARLNMEEAAKKSAEEALRKAAEEAEAKKASSSNESKIVPGFEDARKLIRTSGLEYDDVYKRALRAVGGQSRGDDPRVLRSAHTMLTNLELTEREAVQTLRSGESGDEEVRKWIELHGRIRMALQSLKDAGERK